MFAHENFAVMLNANARRVSQSVRRRIERIVPPEQIFYSHDATESRDITREIKSRGYPVVFTGGGDGTFVKFVNDYVESPRSAQPHLAAVPNIGVLHLGTGNAVAGVVSSGNFECDLKSYINSGSKDFQPLHLVQAEGTRFPFGGLGWDAEILNDYMGLKRSVGANRLLKPVVQNLGGYFAALFTRTIPRKLANLFSKVRTEVRITNLGSEAHVLHGGEPVKAYGPNEVLYEGPTNITLFGTIPYYGHGMTVLPYSMTRNGFFHLRTATFSMAKALTHLRSIWKGSYVGPDMLDWHAKHVRLEFSHAVPYQYGGDAAGYRETVDVQVTPFQVNLLRFI